MIRFSARCNKTALKANNLVCSIYLLSMALAQKLIPEIFGFLSLRRSNSLPYVLFDSYRYAAVCGSIAETYADLAEYVEAEIWYLKEVTYRNEDDYEELCSVYLSLVNCALKQKDQEKLLNFGRKATENATKCRQGSIRKNVYDKLAKAYCEIGGWHWNWFLLCLRWFF